MTSTPADLLLRGDGALAVVGLGYVGLPRPYAAYCLFWQLFHAAQKRRRDAS